MIPGGVSRRRRWRKRPRARLPRRGSAGDRGSRSKERFPESQGPARSPRGDDPTEHWDEVEAAVEVVHAEDDTPDALRRRPERLVNAGHRGGVLDDRGNDHLPRGVHEAGGDSGERTDLQDRPCGNTCAPLVSGLARGSGPPSQYLRIDRFDLRGLTRSPRKVQDQGRSRGVDDRAIAAGAQPPSDQASKRVVVRRCCGVPALRASLGAPAPTGWFRPAGARGRLHPPRRSSPDSCPALGCDQQTILRWPVLGQQIPLAGIAHNCGTVRFGVAPSAPAPDVNCKAHDVDNLDVADTNFFPYSSGVNPSLTASANALPVRDHSARAARLAICRQPRDHKLERA